MAHLARFNQLRCSQPAEAPLGERGLRRVEVSRDRLCVRAADPSGVRREPLLPDGPEVRRVGIEEMLATDLPGRVEECEADPDGHLEERPLLAIRLRDEPGVERRELLRSGEPGRVVAKVGERLLERIDFQRGDVDQPRRRAARALESPEQLVHRRDARVVRQHSGRLELSDEGVEVDPGSARDVGRRCQEPERREAERKDRAELDDVAASLPNRQLPGGRLDLAGDLRGRSLHPTDELHGDPQQVLRGGLVEP